MSENKLFYKACKKNIRGNPVIHKEREVVRGRVKSKEIFLAFHANLMGGHTGQTKTANAISERFFWPGMWEDIRKWVCPL